MAKKEIREYYRVVVEPRNLGNLGGVHVPESVIESSAERRREMYAGICDDIADEIKRHVDNIGCVSVEHDTRYVCEYCGYEWEEDENGVPLCCVKAEEEWLRNVPQREG